MSGIPPELLFVLIFVAFSVLEGVGRKKKADRERVAPPPEVARADSSASAPKPASGGSEGLIPEDVWAEILGLAKGTTPKPDPEPVKEPIAESSWDRGRREDETLEVLPEFEARSLEPLEARPDVVRADWSRVPASSSGKAQKKPSAPAVVTSRPKGGGRARRAIFGGGSSKELQKAVILQEVLGPPVGMKE